MAYYFYQADEEMHVIREWLFDAHIGKVISVGRHLANDIVLVHYSIFPYHIKLHLGERGQMMVEDLQNFSVSISMPENKTLHNKWVLVSPADRVIFNDCEFVLLYRFLGQAEADDQPSLLPGQEVESETREEPKWKEYEREVADNAQHEMTDELRHLIQSIVEERGCNR